MSQQNALTYILVDFENLQPPDMGLLSGEQYHLRIFRGPHQNKLDFDIVESLQPHGSRVQHIQSDQHGPNALDFHIAFHMGRLIESLESNGANARENTRFVVISKDKGFDPLMTHVRSLGYGAMKAKSIRQALGLDEPEVETGIALPSTPIAKGTPAAPNSRALPSPPPAAKPPVSSKAAPVVKAPAVKPAAAKKKVAAPQATPTATPAKKSQAPGQKTLGPEDKEKVIEHLRLHPKNRPRQRKTLEAYIASSVIGGQVPLKAVRGLIASLENEKVITFNGDKIVGYGFPKRK